MATQQVSVPRLNKRTAPVENLADKSNIVGQVWQGFQFESQGPFHNGAGAWFWDRDGYYYWAGGLHSVSSTPLTAPVIPPAIGIPPPFDFNQCWWLKDFKVDQLWAQGLTGKDVKIAILDTGVDLPHPDLNMSLDLCHDVTGSPLGVKDLEELGHGTHCTGIIKASNNGFGVTGVAYDSTVLVCKVSADPKKLGDKVTDDMFYLQQGILWAISQGVDLISISKGNTGDYLGIEDSLQAAVRKNILVICAGGNYDGEQYTEIFYPALYPECLSVGAARPGNTVDPDSVVSDHLNLIAPGVDIRSTTLNGGYKVLSGSSQAAPFVTGITALTIQYLRQKGKTYNAAGLKQLLIDSADPVPGCKYRVINPLNIINQINHGKETII